MQKLERVQAALRGEPVDRPPYSFWTHMPGIDLDPQRLAAATVAFYQRYDLDFIKSMPNGLYCVEDWGCVCDYSEIERGGVARVVQPAVTSAVDWSRLDRVDVTRGAYGRELAHLRMLIESTHGEAPVLATAFSPLTIAGKLSNGASREHVESDPQALLHGLEVITEVTRAFAREAIALGCAGIFFAVQEATRDVTEEAAYATFGEPSDAGVLTAAEQAGGWLNVLHLHGENVHTGVLLRSTAHAVNWHIGETPPSISDYRAAGGMRAIVGGLQRGHITRREQAKIEADIASAMVQTNGRGIFLAPACVIRHPVDDETLTWIAGAIRALRA